LAAGKTYQYNSGTGAHQKILKKESSYHSGGAVNGGSGAVTGLGEPLLGQHNAIIDELSEKSEEGEEQA
jgi:hypothetical protein